MTDEEGAVMKSPAIVEKSFEGLQHRIVIRKGLVTAICVALISGVIVGSASYAAAGPTDEYFKWAQKSAQESLASGRVADAARWEAQAEKSYLRVRNSPREALASGGTIGAAPNADTYVSNRGQQR
jgi:hypothetical protein